MDEKSEPKIDIAENALTASLVLPKDYDRSALTQAVCESLLASSDVAASAVDQDAVIEIITEVMASEPGRFVGVIAKATPAVHGVDARIEWQVESSPDEPDPAEEADENEEDEAVCFYGKSTFTVVKTGDVLGKIYLEVPGTEGRDVRGKIIAARTAKQLDFKYDESIGVDENNNLIAQIDGVLIRDRITARVSDTLEVDQNVDFSTGNIDFPGNVLVRQGVKDCFTIQARDNIEVRGLIEAANLIAGKDLHAKGGFAGREEGTAEIEGTVYGKYLDGVNTTIGTDLCVEREIINCNCTVLGSINSPRGSLIGGSTHVSGQVELMDLGANAQPITELHVGALPLLDPLIEELSALVAQMIEERGALLEEQEMITANSGARIAPTHQAKLDQIRQKMGQLQIQLDRAEPSLQSVCERAESIRTIDLKINRVVHPNALIICGDYKYRVLNEIKGPVRITANKRGQLEVQQGDTAPKLLSTESELRTAA
ncbi:MAG: DUF342 domain-containing protein [Phycisphaeraceae bacterium]